MWTVVYYVFARTNKLTNDERLAASPFGVETDGDGCGEGWFTEYVGYGTAVYLVPSNRVIVVQISWQ